MNKSKTIITISTLVFVCVGLMSISTAQASVQDQKNQWKKEKGFYKDTRRESLKEKRAIRGATKEQIQKNAKEHLIKIIDRLLMKLDTIETWVNNRNALSDLEKSKITAEIQEDKNWLNNKKSEVQDATRDEIKENAKEVRDYWKNNRADIKKIVGEVLASRAEVAVSKMETASEKLSNAIDKAEANGKDVGDAKKLLAEMNSKIDLATTEIESAKRAFSNISSIRDADKLFREGKQHVEKARNYLRESYQIAKNIIRELRS